MKALQKEGKALSLKAYLKTKMIWEQLRRFLSHCGDGDGGSVLAALQSDLSKYANS